jgi:hypothetical protein
MLNIILIIFILSLISSTTYSVRNHKEEAICQPFLTSQRTSPLKKNINRNLDKDEEGEFSCELVLQDETLPLQIRFTIHEGLSWLMTRHIQMGLVRHKELVRHLRILAEIMPSSHEFNLRAGILILFSNFKIHVTFKLMFIYYNFIRLLGIRS